MKNLRTWFTALCAIAFVGSTLLAQQLPPLYQYTSKDPKNPRTIILSGSFEELQKQMTEEDGKIAIAEFQEVLRQLDAILAKRQQQLADNEKQLASLQAAAKKCEDDLLALVGGSKDDINRFRERLGRLEGRVRELKALNDDQLLERQAEVRELDAEVTKLRGEKIAVLPEFFNRVIAVAKDIKGLYREPKTKFYTVGTWAKDRDCLWNIAGKADIYDDPFMWTKVWLANKDLVRNPDIIQPGQKLEIPKKTDKSDDEKKAERRYFRNKRIAAEKAESNAGTTTPDAKKEVTKPSDSKAKSGAN